MNLGRDIEHGGYPTSETRTIGQMRRDADQYAGIGRRGRAAAGTLHSARAAIVQAAEADSLATYQKGVDSPRTNVVGSLNAPIMAPPIQEPTTMTFTFKSLSKNGKQAYYSGGAQVLRFPLGAFVNKIHPTALEIVGEGGDLAEPKTPRAARVPMTAAEKEAAKLARKNAPKPTEAERIARAETALAKRKAKLAASAQPEL